MGLPKPYLSPSQINMYLRCPAQYKFRYIDQIVVPPKSAITKGRCVHLGVEYNFRQKIETFQDLAVGEVKEYTAAEFEKAAEETEWEQGEDKGAIKDETISLIELYHTEVAPEVQPVLVEEKVEVPLTDEYYLLGIIDVLDTDNYIRDIKTTGRTPAKSAVENSLQLTAYSLAHRELMGYEEAGVKLDYLVQTKTPKVVPLTAKRTERDIERLKKITAMVARAITDQIFYPNPTGFMCNERNCGYWQLCQKEF